MTEDERDSVVRRVGDEAYIESGHLVQEKMLEVVRKLKCPGDSSPHYVGLLSIAGSILPVAMALAAKPDWNDEVKKLDPEKQADADKVHSMAWSLIKPENIMFAALLAVHCARHPNEHTTSFEFSPETCMDAIRDWEKLYPDKKIEQFVDQVLIQATRDRAAQAEEPLEKFLKSRKDLPPSTNSVN